MKPDQSNMDHSDPVKKMIRRLYSGDEAKCKILDKNQLFHTWLLELILINFPVSWLYEANWLL